MIVELLLGALLISLLVNLIFLARGMQGRNLRTVVLDGVPLAFTEPVWERITRHCTRQERIAIAKAISTETSMERARRRLEADRTNAKLTKKFITADQQYKMALVLFHDAVDSSTRRWLRTDEGSKWRDDHGIYQDF